MEILTETKLQINNYMLNNFKSKGTAGYLYTKRILEHLFQQYKDTGYIDSPRLSKIIKNIDFKVSYGAVIRAINYFLNTEKITSTISDFIIDTLEQAIEFSRLKIVDNTSEEEF